RWCRSSLAALPPSAASVGGPRSRRQKRRLRDQGTKRVGRRGRAGAVEAGAPGAAGLPPGGVRRRDAAVTASWWGLVGWGGVFRGSRGVSWRPSGRFSLVGRTRSLSFDVFVVLLYLYAR
ncbi:unnamed protein product, partial [Scytosiphon promiscuus]